ncbi:orotate phosphoribosyltransferase [bacterium]|nr:orotate phosphoribosyltransferase [bacterium]MCP5462907.1 orotate phosphoribosyltransferase [bacterium]
MKDEKLLQDLRESDALLSGHFLLSSGLHSGQYIQCAKLLQYPERTARAANAIARHFVKKEIRCVVGPALGGIVIAYKVAEALGIRSIFGERQDQQMCLRRGFTVDKGEKVIVVEDVITTGKSVRELIDVLNSYGADVVGVASIIDRSKNAIDFGCEFFSLMALDIATYHENECPLCAEKIPVVKPGSRGIS